MTQPTPATPRETHDGEVLKLRLRLYEMGAALRNQQASFNDMLEQLQRREEEAVALAGERAARSAAEEAARRLSFLAEASAVLGRSLDFETTLREVARLAVPVVADYAVVHLVDPDGRTRHLATYHRDAQKVELVRRLVEQYPAPPDSEAGAPKVIRTGETDANFDVTDELLRKVARDARHLAVLRELQISSYIAVPLLTRRALHGVFTVVYAESGRRHHRADVALIEDLGRRAAAAIESARLVRGLEEAQHRLEEQAQELEAQTRELMQTAAELEQNTEELRRANAALGAKSREAERARLAAESANAAKSQFLSMLSHELRTPLNAIAGYGELLAIGVHGPLTEEQRNAVSRIDHNQKRLLSMIDDMLNFSRIEAGKLDLRVADVTVVDVFESVASVMQPQFDRKKIALRMAPCDAQVRVRADREKLEQVVLNLASNALKFTPPGGAVTVDCEATESHVVIRVSDNGIGIPEGSLQNIFEPFVQVQTTRTADNVGVGLGLSISRQLTRAMGGELSVASVEGEGSVFSLEMPRGSDAA